MSNFSAELYKAASGAKSRPLSKARSTEPFESPVFEEYLANSDINGYMTALWKGAAARDKESLRILFYLAVQDGEVEDAVDIMDMMWDTDDPYIRTYLKFFKEHELDKMTEEEKNDDAQYKDRFKTILCLTDIVFERNVPDYKSPFKRFGNAENALLRAYLNNVGRQTLPEASEEVEQGQFKDLVPQETKDEWRSLYRRRDCSSNQMSIYEEAKPYAELGDPFAMYIIGYALSHGIQTKYSTPQVVLLPANHDEALRWLERAAKADVPEAQWEAAQLWMNKDDKDSQDEAMRYIKRGIELGDKDCIKYMAEHSPDAVERFKQLTALVEKDTTHKSRLQLAECYEKGLGCEKDERKAFELVEYVYNHSSVSPYDSSQEKSANKLAEYLRTGFGCEIDTERAGWIESCLDDDNDRMWELLTR